MREFVTMILRTSFAVLSALSALLVATPAGAGNSRAATVRLNVRGGPGLDHPVLDQLRVGERVLINTCQGDWCRITHVGISGWVFAPYLVSATFSQTWSAGSADRPATLPSDSAPGPDLGVSVDLSQPKRCPSRYPYC